MNNCTCTPESLAMGSFPIQKWCEPYELDSALYNGTIFPCLNMNFYAAEDIPCPFCDKSAVSEREKAMNEIVAMTAVNEKETATENLLAAKGFQDVVVTIVDDSVDVIVNAESLKEQQIAQIEDVVKRKLECASDKIVISPVGKKE